MFFTKGSASASRRIRATAVWPFYAAMWDGKGKKARTVPIPQSIMQELLAQLERIKEAHAEDLKSGYAGVLLDDSLEKKYRNAAKDFIWQ